MNLTKENRPLAILPSTKQEYEKFLNYIERLGYSWAGGSPHLNNVEYMPYEGSANKKHPYLILHYYLDPDDRKTLFHSNFDNLTNNKASGDRPYTIMSVSEFFVTYTKEFGIEKARQIINKD